MSAVESFLLNVKSLCSLVGSKVSDTDADRIGKAVSERTYLEDVNLDSYVPWYHNIFAFHFFFFSNLHFSITDSSLSNDGMAMLVRHLRDNSHVTGLVLWRNNANSTKALFETVQTMRNLQRFSTDVSDANYDEFEKLLLASSRLNAISLCVPDLCGDNVARLFRTIENNRVLTKLCKCLSYRRRIRLS
jgi:hypothetical protein